MLTKKHKKHGVQYHLVTEGPFKEPQNGITKCQVAPVYTYLT